ncbi:MAG TPA: hypothetical protein VJU13_11480 [Candidatus Nitrosocosmicus sp.]|nr:hypothetical protein [Candidatus Nitrosocosmicus sp.]
MKLLLGVYHLIFTNKCNFLYNDKKIDYVYWYGSGSGFGSGVGSGTGSGVGCGWGSGEGYGSGVGGGSDKSLDKLDPANPFNTKSSIYLLSDNNISTFQILSSNLFFY